MRRPKPGEELDYHNRHLWESDDEEFDSEEEDPAPKVRDYVVCFLGILLWPIVVMFRYYWCIGKS